MERARKIGSVGMQVDVKHLLIGADGVALSLHNTASHAGKIFDMHLVTARTLGEDKIVRIDTFMHDIEMVNQFFENITRFG